MKVAVIGTGVSGLVAAYKLQADFEVDIYEANNYAGGHTNTIDVKDDGDMLAVDTGFIVFNDWTYPNFIKLLRELNVTWQPTAMGFSVRSDRDNLEYCGSSLSALFAQKRNFFRPGHYRMLADIVKFNNKAIQDSLLGVIEMETTLAQYLIAGNYSREFISHYLLPMGAAIWSSDPARMLEFPARTFINFFKNHGLLSLKHRPNWHVIQGGSKCYVEQLLNRFRGRIYLNSLIKEVQRAGNQVRLINAAGREMIYDKVVIAAHSDQALALLSKPSRKERQVLGAISYQANEAILHTDISLLPRIKRAWAAWNYHIPNTAGSACTLTYNMNILQSLNRSKTYCVTLNNTAAINPGSIIRRINYTHPIFDLKAIKAQKRWSEINGVNNTYYCGAYWGFGFHEDGVNSALRVVDRLKQDRLNEKLYIQRAS